jgi:stage V sporulation protein G
MEITAIKITPLDHPKVRAFVSVTFDNSDVVRGIKIIRGPDGLFVAMPSRRESCREIPRSLKNAARKWLESMVIDLFDDSGDDGDPPKVAANALPVPERLIRLRVGAERRRTSRG